MYWPVLIYASLGLALPGWLAILIIYTISEDNWLWLIGMLLFPIYFVPLYASRDIRKRIIPLMMYLCGLLAAVLAAIAG